MKTALKTSAAPTLQRKPTQPFFGKGGTGAFLGSSPFIQAKLNVGQPNDPYEREADQMADHVVQRLAQSPTPFAPASVPPPIQAKCADCEAEDKLQKKEDKREEKPNLQTKPIFESASVAPDDDIQRKCADCEAEGQPIQRKESNAEESMASSSLEGQLSASKGGGSPLPEDTRQQMEGSMGADFSEVRVHTGGSAVQMSQDLSAHAFTHGSDIYFNSGKYDTGSSGGQHLLAHELTHTMQQGANSIQRFTFFPELRTNRELINEALTTQSLTMALQIRNYSEATTEERVQLIQICLNQFWVGPFVESAIESIWESFGNALPGIITSREGIFSLWKRSYEAGADVDDLTVIEGIKQRFKEDVKEIAHRYLYINRQYILDEMQSLGISEGLENQSQSDLAYLTEIQRAASQVQQAQQVQQALRQIPVGSRPIYSHVEDQTPTYVPVHFDPNDRPPLGPDHEDMADWAEVKEQYDRVSSVIAGIGNRYPSIYSLLRNDKIGEFSSPGSSSSQALSIVRNSFIRVLQDIDETVPKIDNNDIEYYDFTPIHQQMFEGTITGSSGILWNNEFYKWVAEDDLSDHESREFWIQLGFATLAAAAFVVAELATAGTATFFIASGIGIGLTGGVAAYSWEHYLDLAQTARTNVSDETALVLTGQVDAAFIDAILNTAFAFIDVYAPLLRLARAGTTTSIAATTAARREFLAISQREMAEATATETAQRRATQQIGESFVEETEQRAGQSFAGETLQMIRQFMNEFVESVRNWARLVFDQFGFKSYQVVDEGEWLTLYGIRSRVLLARFKKDIIRLEIIDPNIAAFRSSRISQLSAARRASRLGRNDLANVLRHKAILLSEEIGEEGAMKIITKEFPTAELVYRGSGRNTLDLVYKIPDGSFIVVEAKGGMGKISTRQVAPGVGAQQGTVTYLRSILRAMESSNSSLAQELRQALGPPRRLRYFFSTTPIPIEPRPLQTFLQEFV